MPRDLRSRRRRNHSCPRVAISNGQLAPVRLAPMLGLQVCQADERLHGRLIWRGLDRFREIENTGRLALGIERKTPYENAQPDRTELAHAHLDREISSTSPGKLFWNRPASFQPGRSSTFSRLATSSLLLPCRVSSRTRPRTVSKSAFHLRMCSR